LSEDSKANAFISIETVHFVDRELEKFKELQTSERERLREVIMEKFNAIKSETSKDFVELQRRLTELNHAHQEMVADKAHFQPRELADQRQHEYDTWRDGVNATLNNQAGRIAAYISLIGFGILLLNHYWK